MYPWSPLPRNAGAALRDASDTKSHVRLSAIADLARLGRGEGGEACVARLIELVERDADVEVRASAALALADAEAPSALPALLSAASWGPPRLRQMALVAIGELAPAGDDAAVAAVRSALQSDAPALRFQALVAAGRLLTPAELAPCVESALSDPQSKVRYIACRVLEERILDGAADETTLPVWQAALERLLADVEEDVRLAAALLLARRGSKAARDLIVGALNRRRSFSQPEDEQAAIELCAELRLDAARPGLRARAFGGAFSGSSPLAFQARVALARLGDARACRYILRGLSSWSRTTRAQCVVAAGLARLEQARPRLLEMRRRGGELERKSAGEALLALDRRIIAPGCGRDPALTKAVETQGDGY